MERKFICRKDIVENGNVAKSQETMETPVVGNSCAEALG